MMTLLAQQETRPLFEFTLAPLWQDNGIPLAIMGVLVVFSALMLVVICISLLPRVLGRIAAVGHPQQAVVESENQDVTFYDDDQLPEETLIVIAAAVAEVLDRPHRIVKIRGLGPIEQAWSIEGRMKHHFSHRIQHRDRK